MSQRERQPSAAAPPPADPRPPDAGPPPGADRPAPWQHLCRLLPGSQRAELLALARRQGLLYAHQLPPTPVAIRDPARAFLNALLAGKTQDLVPVAADPAALGDCPLDASQRAAVARALQTPDLCLIQGLPGSGKSRVVAEIIQRSAARGERVLLLAPSAPALDRALGLVGGSEVVCPVRCLGLDEAPESLPPAARALLFDERARWLRQNALAGAARQAVEAEEAACRLRRDQPAFEQLRQLADELEQVATQRASLLARAAGAALAAEVEADARAAEAPGPDVPPGPFGEAVRSLSRTLAEARAAHEQALAELGRKADQARHEQSDFARRWQQIEPLVRAREEGGLLNVKRWLGAFRPGLAAQAAELRARRQQVAEALSAYEADIAQHTTAFERGEAEASVARSRLIAEEVARRQEQLHAQVVALDREQGRLDKGWREVLRCLDAGTPRPTAQTLAAVEEALALGRNKRQDAEAHRAFAEQWTAYLQDAGPDLAQQLQACTNLVAATTGGLTRDEHFGETPGREPVAFDLLILEDAAEVTEAEFLTAARRCRRWVLVGGLEAAVAPTAAVNGPRRPDARKPKAALRPSIFHRLWQHLHCDPRRLPYAWAQEPDGRLCCRLRPVMPEQRAWVERERVADFPDIELRIVAPPRDREPFLAEVVFPPSMSLAQATEFIYRELSELPVRAPGHTLGLTEEPDRIVLRLEDGTCDTGTLAIPLGGGVRELVAGTDAPDHRWHTCRVEFDRAAGWQRAAVEAWVWRHLGLRDLGRTALLDRPHRMAPRLAAVVADLLCHPPSLCPACFGEDSSGVEFVPVPGHLPARRGGEGHRIRDGRAGGSGHRGGAGLEVDLGDGRHRDRLPTDLRASLPQRGLVNFLEAQAVVRLLERLVRSGDGRAPDLAVIALYPAQAQLIRLLMGQRPDVFVGVDVPVGVPAAFREREHQTVLVSLTRSHAHRAVSYGEGPQALPLALTRARGRLVLFGDPGTLARRAEWENALEQLDDAAAFREREVVGRLHQYLHGQGKHPRGFQVRPAPAAERPAAAEGRPPRAESRV